MYQKTQDFKGKSLYKNGKTPGDVTSLRISAPGRATGTLPRPTGTQSLTVFPAPIY